MKKIFFIFVTFFLFGVSFSSAALNGELVVYPEYPKAYDPITVTLQSYSFDVDLAMITWKVGGEVFASGVGLKKIKTNTGATGELTTIEAKAVLQNGDYVVVSYNLSPQTIDLVWEASESYVPPFYEGKALPAENSVVRVIALPSFVERGRLVNPGSVAYTWSINDSVISSKSGMGKQVLTTRLDYLSDSSVVKVVARTSGGLIAESRIKLTPEPILPTFYAYDDVLGANYAEAIKARLETTKAVSLKLEPYFISKVSGADPGDTYLWTLGGLPIETETPTLVRLQPKENSYGIKKLSVSAQNTKRRLQQAVASLEIVFDSR